MADNERKDLKELEIDGIIEERNFIADRSVIAKAAEKYKSKPKIDEIFSNTDKHPRLKSVNPLELFGSEKIKMKPAKKSDDNSIVGEKTAATMQASLLLDGSDEELVTPEQKPAEPVESVADNEQQENSSKNEDNKPESETKATEKSEEDDNEFVTLTPEYAEDTSFSNEVLGEVDQFKENKNHIQSINSIDIESSAEEYQQEEKKEEQQEQEKFNELFGVKSDSEGKPPKKVVAKVPVYKPEEQVSTLNVKAGRFSEVVQREYEEYIRCKNPSVMAHVIKPEPKPANIEDDEEEISKPKDNRSKQEKLISALVGFFSKDESDDEDIPQEKVKPVEDYTGDDDEKSILYELNLNIKKLFLRTSLTGIIALVSVILTIITRVFPEAICSAVPFAPAAYAVMNLLLVGFSVFVNQVSILSGLTPLVKFKGNSDTAVAVGAVTAVLQAITSFFCLGDLSTFRVNYYSAIVLLAFFANNLGKLFMVLRVKDNFRFTASKGQKYAAKIYNNESIANQMMSGTASDKNIIAYQHKTDFPANFLKISYAPDPSEDLASKLAPITTIAAVLISIIYGGSKVSFAGAINSLALLSAVSIPVVTLLAVNYPVRKFCKTLLSFGAMLSGYPSIKQFCDSTAIMIDANELFPADCIELEGIKTFEEYNVDESLLCGIAILKEADSPIANAFDSVMEETKETLPEVESVLYEDEMGLVGWINSERILVGSRRLMEKYNVQTPRKEYEENYIKAGKQITYISRAGRLVAMFVTSYSADLELKSELQRAEANGISFLIRTTDYNITNDLVAKKYDLFYRSIKVLPTGLGNVLKESEGIKEESSRAYLITGGKISSLARAVSGSVIIKHNISLSIMIQLIAIVLGLLVGATLSLYASVDVMGSLEVLIYSVFWAAAAIVAPALRKP